MPGVYKIPMVRMTEMSDEAPECKGLKVPHSEMGVWVKVQAVRFSRNGCYETPWHVTGVSKLSGPEGTPKGMYVQIGLSEQGKVLVFYLRTLQTKKISCLTNAEK